MSVIITIDGRRLECNEGETLLNIARANGVFIPAICYLNRCSATLACRLCLVEADGKQVFACNAKAKDGMNIVTNSEEIKIERKAIMQAYDINHPLECGVCDKSGSCELQNYTLEEKVDVQEYAICDTYKPTKDWGLIKYDPSLCIVCERCVTACSDLIGDKAITTVARGGNELDKTYKETMPKNAFTIWQRFNKNLIGIKSGADKLDCTLCGECVAVCPVGAMTSAHFTYASNAWEMTKIPSSCAHCSSACELMYEVKHKSIAKDEQKIYRVTNDWHFQTLCGAGRYGFDYANEGEKNEADYKRGLEALNKAKTIKFNGFITNEEALMLQTLKEKLGVKLYSPINLAYKKFLSAYSATSGSSLYSADSNNIRKSNFIVSVGSFLKNDAPGVRYAVNNALSNKGALIYAHPINDLVIGGMSKNVLQLNHAVGVEESVLWLLLQLFANREALSEDVKQTLQGFDAVYKKTVSEKIKKKVDEIVIEKVTDKNGVESEISKTVQKEVEEIVTKEVEVKSSKLLKTLGLAEDYCDKIEALLAKKDSFALILGADLYFHARAKEIAELAGFIEKTTSFKTLIIPPQTNSLGVSLICDLDEEVSGYAVGYNESADFIFSGVKGFGDIATPAMNQQEGTITNVDKRVVPLNSALKFDGYELNDFMGEFKKAQTVDWTDSLPQNAGFKRVKFDDLHSGFLNDGTEVRGYALDVKQVEIKRPNIDYIEHNQIDNALYFSRPVNGFNAWTKESKILGLENNVLICSKEFADANNLQDGDQATISEVNLKVKVSIDKKIGGGVVYAFDINAGYPFINASILKG